MADPSSVLDLRVDAIMRTDLPTMAPEDPCSIALSKFANDGAPAVLVVDDKGRYKGLVSERDVLRSGVDPAKSPVQHLLTLHALPTLGPEATVVEAASAILDANARGIAVVDKDEKVVGALVREDIILAAGERDLVDREVASVMTAELQVGRSGDTVASALSRMKREGFSHMPVIDDGKLEGIVTVHDLIRRVLAPLRGAGQEGWKTGPRDRPLGVPLGGVLTSPVVTVTEEETYGNVAELFAERRIGSVVVTEDGDYPHGIVTRRDLLEPVALLREDVPLLVVQFSSKDASREGYESSGAPKEVRSFLERYQKHLEPGLLHIHAKKHKDRNRGLELWHVRLNLSSDMGKFYAVGEGWGMQHATRLGIDRLEREVRRVKEERQDYPSREFVEELLY